MKPDASTRRIMVLFLAATLPLVWIATVEPRTPHLRASAGLTLYFLGVAPALTALLYGRLPRSPQGPLTRYGQSRRRLALKQQFQTTLWLYVAAVLGTSVAFFTAYTCWGDGALNDAIRTVPILLAAVVALSGTFAFAYAWAGKLGLLALLVLCWIAAPEAGAWSQGLATAHLRTLLAVGEQASTPSWISYAALVGSGCIGSLLATWRIRA